MSNSEYSFTKDSLQAFADFLKKSHFSIYDFVKIYVKCTESKLSVVYSTRDVELEVLSVGYPFPSDAFFQRNYRRCKSEKEVRPFLVNSITSSEFKPRIEQLKLLSDVHAVSGV